MDRHVERDELAAVVLALTALAALGSAPRGAGAEEGRGGVDTSSEGRAGLVVRFDPSLEEEAVAVGEALRLRLGRHGVDVRLDRSDGGPAPEVEDADRPAPSHPGARLWAVHLRRISGDHILVAVDRLDSESEDDVVLEVRRGKDIEATSWTLSLAIEEAVLPYIDDASGDIPVGAGLAIIEPPEVGGGKSDAGPEDSGGARTRFVGLALTVLWVGATDDFVPGPRVVVEGLFAERLVASLSIAWAGWARFSAAGVDGSVCYLPIDAMLGFLALSHSVVDISILGGLSAGFAIYQTSMGDDRRTDALFDPWVQARIRLSFHVHGPVGIYLEGGCGLALTRDELRNAGAEVYRQDWVLPAFDVGAQIWL